MSTKTALVLDVQRRYKIPQSCSILGISRSHFYKHVLSRIKVIREGNAVFIPGSELVKLAQPPEQPAAVPITGRGRPRRAS
jgi:hypothetical protein